MVKKDLFKKLVSQSEVVLIKIKCVYIFLEVKLGEGGHIDSSSTTIGLGNLN